MIFTYHQDTKMMKTCSYSTCCDSFKKIIPAVEGLSKSFSGNPWQNYLTCQDLAASGSWIPLMARKASCGRSNTPSASAW